MKILLVEPAYKNKYPPMGLMKISTYHKQRGDKVIFYKGLLTADILQEIDRVYITSLFTFYFNKTIETIEYYKKYFDQSQIYVGGIMVTIMQEKIQDKVGNVNFLSGLLTDSSCLGLQDKVNIDELPLDYGILDECEYEYPAGDNYFAYTTRGCPNKCSFCAVPLLEPEYRITNNIKKQVMEVNQKYGERRNLLLLDNNIFNLDTKSLRKLVDDMKAAGFTQEPSYIKETIYERIIKFPQNNLSKRILDHTETYLREFEKKIKNKELKVVYAKFLAGIDQCQDKKIYFCEHKEDILPIIQKYKYKVKMKRYVDFNQGLEAGRITAEKMSILAELPLRPVRIAFDHYNDKFVEKYVTAIKISKDCGIKEFSNYMLYNFDDKPEDLWNRLKLNIDLAKDYGINIFSFPMKYMPITETDRKHIGSFWNRKFLSGVQAILLVTKGIVADGEDFFYRAYGKTSTDFIKILTMPKDFITYRSYYEKQGLTAQWEELYDKLNDSEKEILLNILNGNTTVHNQSRNLLKITEFYNHTYSYNILQKGDA